MNKLLDDSVKVANKMNPGGYMVLPTKLFFFLRHMLVVYLLLLYKIQALYNHSSVKWCYGKCKQVLSLLNHKHKICLSHEAWHLERAVRCDGMKVVLEHLAPSCERCVTPNSNTHNGRPIWCRACRRRLDPAAEVLIPVHHHARVAVES